MSSEGRPAQVPEGARQAGEDLWQRYGAERGVWTKPMLEALARGLEGNKWFSLVDKVYDMRTLGLAWERVQSNAGACGVDGMTVGLFSKDSVTRLLAVNGQLREGRYLPKPVKRVWIPKPGSTEKRPLGIPAVVDRVVQTALRMVIEPIFERQFSPTSYGFRPGRGCKDALREVNGLYCSGHQYIVDVDIKGYFDAIPHERLMALVREHIADGRVLALIEGYLKQGVMDEGHWTQSEDGTPQGGVISPLLANLYLNPLDWQMSGAGYRMVRYADDMVVLCRTQGEAEAALEMLRGWMGEAGLTLHPEKTRIVDMRERGSHFDFLGYRFVHDEKGRRMRKVRPKSLTKIKDSIRLKTSRSNGHSMEAIVAKLNPTLRGWFGYYKQAHMWTMTSLDGWVRMRLRSILRQRAGKKGRGRGFDHSRWPNHYFAGLGLYSLKEAKEAVLASLLPGATH